MTHHVVNMSYSKWPKPDKHGTTLAGTLWNLDGTPGTSGNPTSIRSAHSLAAICCWAKFWCALIPRIGIFITWSAAYNLQRAVLHANNNNSKLGRKVRLSIKRDNLRYIQLPTAASYQLFSSGRGKTSGSERFEGKFSSRTVRRSGEGHIHWGKCAAFKEPGNGSFKLRTFETFGNPSLPYTSTSLA